MSRITCVQLSHRLAHAALLQDREREGRGGDEEAALGDATRGGVLQAAVQLSRRRTAGEGVFKGLRDADDGIGGFVDELGAEVANAGVEPIVQVRGGFLRLCSEDGVAAAHVRHDGMGAAARIAQFHAMPLAGPAAIAIAGSGRKKAAEDAVLGVKHGEVVVDDGLDLIRTGALGELGDLRGVQIVRGRDAVETAGKKLAGGDGVGRVQAEVARETPVWLMPQ